MRVDPLLKKKELVVSRHYLGGDVKMKRRITKRRKKREEGKKREGELPNLDGFRGCPWLSSLSPYVFISNKWKPKDKISSTSTTMTGTEEVVGRPGLGIFPRLHLELKPGGIQPEIYVEWYLLRPYVSPYYIGDGSTSNGDHPLFLSIVYTRTCLLKFCYTI